MTSEQFLQRCEPEPNSGCWIWLGARNSEGYGTLIYEGRPERAHRLAWILVCGAIPAAPGHHGMCVLHRCDTPWCVNPAHLFLGTNRDNVLDRERKGRGPNRRGEANGRAKLTAELVDAIRRRHDPQTMPSRRLAAEYGVSQTTVLDIVRGVQWPYDRAQAGETK